MTSQVLATIEPKMARAVEVLERDLRGIRTGRASTSLVERIHVEYYGTPTALNQLAGISVPEPHQIVIQPWDRGVLGAIEKAILRSDIGLTPNVDGIVVRLNIPPLTEERRRDLVKVVHRRMEEAKVEIRNLRREAADTIKRDERDGADPVGITGCYCALAETGTLVLLSSPQTPAATHLLPATHIALVPASRIVATMEDAFALLRAERSGVEAMMPRAINMVSGPSRTGDIEQTIVLGAHGPFRVHLVIVGGA